MEMASAILFQTYYYETEELPVWAWVVIIGVSVAYYLLMCFFIYEAAKRLNVTNKWMAWIPIVNLYLISVMAGRKPSEFWLALIFGCFCGIVWLIFLIVWWMEIAKRLGRSPVLGVFAAIPYIGPIFMGIIAFGTPDYAYIQSQQYPPQQGYPPQQYPPQQGYPPQQHPPNDDTTG